MTNHGESAEKITKQWCQEINYGQMAPCASQHLIVLERLVNDALQSAYASGLEAAAKVLEERADKLWPENLAAGPGSEYRWNEAALLRNEASNLRALIEGKK
jgi:hypothetical protein